MKKNSKIIIALLCVFALPMLGGCGLFQFVNLFNCSFNLANISNVSWAGINFSNINSVQDLSFDNLKTAGIALKNKDYVVHCDVNVNVKNDTKRAAKLIGYDYQLFLDNASLATGSSKDKSYTINANSTSQVAVPVQVDLLNIVKNGQIDNIINFVRNLKDYGNGTESNVQVKFTPYISAGDKTQKMPAITLNKTFQ